MNLLLQPNRWSCLPTSVAMALGVPLKLVIDFTGHDGSEIIWPNLSEPLRRKSFHIEEMQYVAFECGYNLVPFVAVVEHEPEPALLSHIIDLRPKFELVLSKFDGVLLGNYVGRPNKHAVAWNAKENCIYDPSGHITKIDAFSTWCFYATVPCGR